MPKEMNERDAKVIQEYLASSKARKQLAISMAAPIRQKMNYQSLGRKIFGVEQLPEPEPCGSCGRTRYDEGHKAGCKECSVRSVLET